MENVGCVACGKPKKIHSKGMCNSCYTKQLPVVLKQCLGCQQDKQILARGLCKSCYRNQPDQLQKSRDSAKQWNKAHPEQVKINQKVYAKSLRTRPYCVVCGLDTKCVHGRRMVKCIDCGETKQNASNGRCNQCHKRLPENTQNSREAALEWYYNNKEHHNAARMERYHDPTKAEMFKAKRQRHYEKHKVDIFQRVRERKQKLDKIPGSHTQAEWESRLLEYNWACAYCLRDDVPMTKDHMTPISWGDKSSNSIDNIVPACQSCNSAKGDDNILIALLKGSICR